VLLVDLNEQLASRLTEAMEPYGLHTASCCADKVLTVIGDEGVTAVVVSLSETTSGAGVELLRAIRRTYPNLRLLAVSAGTSEALALSVFRAGATD